MISVWSALAGDTALSCPGRAGPLAGSCPGPGHPGHTQLPWLLATCVTPWWYNMPSHARHHALQIQSIPTFPYFRKHQTLIPVRNWRIKALRVSVNWCDDNSETSGEIGQRPDRTNNEQLTRWKHRKDNPRKKTSVSWLCLCDLSDFFKFALLNKLEMSQSEEMCECCPPVAFIDYTEVNIISKSVRSTYLHTSSCISMSFLTTCCFAFQTKLNGNKKERPTVLGVR